MPDGVPVHVRLREARKERGLTQTDLAQQLGDLSQPAVSKLESGDLNVVSEEKLGEIARFLGVTLPATLPQRARRAEPALAFRLLLCPNSYCPSNVPCDVGSQLRFVPSMVRAADERVRCAYCGDLLIDACPGCGTPVVQEGACCTACGEPFVAVGLLPEEISDVGQWAKARRAILREIRELTGTREHLPTQVAPAREASGKEG